MKAIQQCNLCSSNQARQLLHGKDRMHNSNEVFSLLECTNCGLIYLNPQPEGEEIARYYPQEYLAYPTAIEDEPSILKRLDRQYGLYKRCQAVISRVKQPGRLLDVGCATGIYLDGMRQRGWQALGVELSDYAANYARQRFGLDVKTGSLAEASFPSNHFDLVTLWDVLEHLSDPKQTLGEIARIMKPGAWLVLSLPNPQAWERRWFKQYWAGWDIPRHFHLFTPQVLSRYLQQAGFELIDVTSFTGRHGGLVLSVQMWLNNRPCADRPRQVILKLIKSLPARILTFPFYTIADRLNRSSYFVVFAKKRLT